MKVTAKQFVAGLFEGRYCPPSLFGIPGGLLCLVLSSNSLADAETTTPIARDLSTAMEELRAAHQAWQENDLEFRNLQQKGEASDVELNDFSDFVDELRRLVLDGCREVRSLGGKPDGQGVGCQQLEKQSRKAAYLLDERDAERTAKRKAEANSKAVKTADMLSDNEKRTAGTGRAKSTAPNQGNRLKQGTSGTGAPSKETRQTSRNERPDVDASRQGGAEAQTRQANALSGVSGEADHLAGQSAPGQPPEAASMTPDRVGTRPLPQSESQRYRSRLEALEAELDGYLTTQLGKAREKATTRRQPNDQARAGFGDDRGAGVAGANGAWGGGDSLSGTGMQPKEPGVGPGLQKEGTPPRWNLPPGVGDGSDDDVVARQLREAAQAETDPETRKRLWEEYKKYKGST